MSIYSYRSYHSGDEKAINALYASITGRKRTADQYFWQWLKCPGGKGEIWLIESEKKKLIGHHGVMPIRFSMGEKCFLFGKTENTFVDPEYRRKILYPRFEGRFRSVYENRFDALFSTMGPVAAIRQRKAQGYHFPAVWKKFIYGTNSLSDLFYLSLLCSKKITPLLHKMFFSNVQNLPAKEIKYGDIVVRHLNRNDANESYFFDAFWKSIRKAYTLTPSREKKDLKWRFWDNPYIQYHTLILDSCTHGSGYVILHSYQPGFMIIDDFITDHPKSKSFKVLFKAVLYWALRSGAHIVQFTTADDSIEWIGRDNFSLRSNLLYVGRLINRSRNLNEQRMPRKITSRGKKSSIPYRPWYLTSMVFEGIPDN